MPRRGIESRIVPAARTPRLPSASRFRGVPAASLCLLLGLLLTACSDDRMNDLQGWVRHVRAMQKGHIEPLPTFKPFETYTYNDAGKDPFRPWDTQTALNAANGVHPNLKRRKESLEAFPLDSLQMVGTLDFNRQRWAAVKAPDGIVYRVKAGNYMGKNSGKIVKVEKGKIELREIVPNGIGGWEVRPAALVAK